MPPAAPIRPRHLVSTQQGVETLAPNDFTVFRDALQVFYVSLRKPARRYTYRRLKIFTSLSLRFQDFQRKLKDVVLSAISKGHTDAIVISTLHPYDIVESGSEMADFRRGSPQININKLIDELHQIKEISDVQFLSFRELLKSGEDLSSKRLHANLRIRRSIVTRHRLLPETFNIYPLTGLFYSQDSANRMHRFQIIALVLLYGTLALIVTFITKFILRRFYRKITALVGVLSVGGILALLVKSFYSGFYMTSAIGFVCCLGLLSGIAFTSREKHSNQKIQRTV